MNLQISAKRWKQIHSMASFIQLITLKGDFDKIKIIIEIKKKTIKFTMFDLIKRISPLNACKSSKNLIKIS